MLRPENTTASQKPQVQVLGKVAFGDPLMEYTSPFLSVTEGGSIIEGLQFACDLADGLTQLCMRLHGSINDGDLAYCAEVRALAFLGETVTALTRSAHRSLSKVEAIQAVGGDQ